MQKITVAILISTMVLLSACNTVKGAGRDIESVCKAGEKAIY